MSSSKLLGREVRPRRPSNGSKTGLDSSKFRSAAIFLYWRSPKGRVRLSTALGRKLYPSFAVVQRLRRRGEPPSKSTFGPQHLRSKGQEETFRLVGVLFRRHL